ncbi:roadblock/LC7 domain-containing protein [Ilumatobacter coccineus]|uniref:Roadblock/LAMTOR2 domain-containing protein n=1 Tax=Ilumatobacter coccineus (strain NBRC 103263 / KCTC 29153 / YM16-304) TaxID=1313172 RepID=A0A6C7E7J7_ILUCY|nr:roadblock/LC7 domain-containing protein [Ilumatobacter coccineus]BAN00578.1 hypothetical protein YM304_02640 [Ilumatobacter coccineus YM16-304]
MNDRAPASSIEPQGSLAPPPASSGFAPPPPPTASYTPRRLPTTAAEVLDEMTEVIPGARGALLASVDGFALARSDSMPNEAAHAAMISAAVGLAHQLVSMGNGTELRQLVVDHDEGLLLLWPVGTDRVLAMLTVSSVDQSRLRGFVRARARLLAEDLR